MIVTAGEALVDLVDHDGSVQAVPGGGPFNTAMAFGRLGMQVGFLGTFSRDAYGQVLARKLRDAGVDTSFARWSDAPTPQAIVHRQGDGRDGYTFHLDGTALVDFSPQELPSLTDDVWAIHVGTLALAVDPPAAAYEALVDREADRLQIIFDPNVRPAIFGDPGVYRRRFERLARLADIVKLSVDDATWIYPGLPDEEVLGVILGFGPRIVAVTRGANGALAGSADGVVEVAGIAINVADTVGAGDSFGAALVTALVDDGAFGPEVTITPDRTVLTRAVSYAVTAAAITCTRTGAVPPSRDEIAARLVG